MMQRVRVHDTDVTFTLAKRNPGDNEEEMPRMSARFSSHEARPRISSTYYKLI